MNLEQIMTPDPELVRGEQPLSEAGRRMVQLGIRHLPVVGVSGRLVGLLTDFDVFRRGAFLDGAMPDGHAGWMAYEKEDDDITCAEAMETAEVTLTANLTADVALAELHRSPQDALVVVDGRFHPVGVLSEHDVLGLALGLVDTSRPVSTIASSPVECLELSEPASVAFERIAASPFRHLVVTQGGELYGVVSLRDLVSDDVVRRTDLGLRDVLRSTTPFSATNDTSIGEVIRTMKDHKVGCVPIIDDQHRPIGIVTRRDVIALVLRPSPA